MTLIKALSAVLGLLCVALLVFAAGVFVLKKEASAPEKLEMLIEKDLDLLRQNGSLPKELNSLAKLEVYGGTDQAKVWINNLSLPFKLAEDGTHDLEVLVVDWEEGTKDGVMVQYNLVDRKSGNMVWELGRTFILRDDSELYYQVRPHLMNWLRH